jgi:RecA-family ATPase
MPNQKIVVDFPDKGWACTELIAAGSSAGKTWYLKEKILRNLLGPARYRRNFLYISNEYDVDTTLAVLKKPKFQKYFTGIDISDSSIANTLDTQTADEFFQKNVKNVILNMPPQSVICIDDALDSLIYKQMFKMINKLLRTGRHSSTGLVYILHRIRSGNYSSQANSSCRYFTIFPRLAKGKVLEFLIDQGVAKREAVRHLEDYSHARSRHMTVRLHSPTCLISEDFLRLF